MMYLFTKADLFGLLIAVWLLNEFRIYKLDFYYLIVLFYFSSGSEMLLYCCYLDIFAGNTTKCSSAIKTATEKLAARIGKRKT